jgi:hypothetical protein
MLFLGAAEPFILAHFVSNVLDSIPILFGIAVTIYLQFLSAQVK